MHISHYMKSSFNFFNGFKLFWIAIKIWHLIFLWFDAKPLNLGIKYLNKIRNLQLYLNVNVFMNKPHLGLLMKKEWPAYIAFTINFDHLVGLLHHLKTTICVLNISTMYVHVSYLENENILWYIKEPNRVKPLKGWVWVVGESTEGVVEFIKLSEFSDVIHFEPNRGYLG